MRPLPAGSVLALLLQGCGGPKAPVDGTGGPADTEGDTATDTDTDTGADTDLADTVVVNEVMAENSAWCNGTPGAFPDWIEIYNPTAEAIALSRITLASTGGLVWTGGSGELAPGGFAVVFADGGAPEDHAPFTIEADGDTLTLTLDGVEVDSSVIEASEKNVAGARFPDGGPWGLTVNTTPGASNEASATLDPLDVLYTHAGIQRIDITLSAEAYDALSGRTEESLDAYEYVEGGFATECAAYDPVGVRLRGETTYQPITGKPAFKIDMNRHEDFRHQG